MDLGCGTGALTEAVLCRCAPRHVLALNPSEGFLAKARESVPDPRAEFRLRSAADLSSVPTNSRDVAVTGLVLNFIPDRAVALCGLDRIVRPVGTIGFYVWDYPGDGIAFMRAFWKAAVALDSSARELNEDRRFPFCTREGLAALVEEVGLPAPEIAAVEAPSVFRDFDDYWTPFTLGAGPAPGYCASLAPEARERLRANLSESLPRRADGVIVLNTRA